MWRLLHLEKHNNDLILKANVRCQRTETYDCIAKAIIYENYENISVFNIHIVKSVKTVSALSIETMSMRFVIK